MKQPLSPDIHVDVSTVLLNIIADQVISLWRLYSQQQNRNIALGHTISTIKTWPRNSQDPNPIEH